MLFKLMKHDFRYSAKLFFALGAIAIALAFIVGSGTMISDSLHLMLLSNFVLFPIAVAAIIHIAQFYRKSMFGAVGHLSLTTPVSRSSLLVSKIAVSIVWFLYTVLIGIAGSTIVTLLSNLRRTMGVRWIFRSLLDPSMIVMGINIIALALAAICLLFFCITLSHSVFKGARLSGIITGVIGVIYAAIYGWVANMLSSRFIITEDRVFTNWNGSTWTGQGWQTPLTGFRYGRMVIGETFSGIEIYLDIWHIAFTMVAAAIAIIATHSLLKNRVSLS